MALGVGALLPSAETATILGLIFFGGGFGLRLGRISRWTLLAQILMTIGALAAVGGSWVLSNGAIEVLAGLTLALAVAAVAARSGLLASLAVLMLAAALGSGTAYWSATYGIWVTRPALTILVLAAVTLGLYLVSLRVPASYERLALIGARTSILLMNVAFLVGSLFGDREVRLDSLWFSIGWALALIAVAIWAARAGRLWVVNTAAAFGALHFYTQWFEMLGASPVSILGGGLLLIAFGFALRWFNRRPRSAAQPA